ncbi:MAG: ferrous iron transport protein B [Anaerolineae bacterium]
MQFQPLQQRFSNPTNKANCHSVPQLDTSGLPLLAIVGCPNVGKSVLFNMLTGTYVSVSNYPGTTVEVSRGKGSFGDCTLGIIDTPGMYRLLPITEEELIARDILLRERPDIVVHVVDAKNLERMLPMTLQLIEAGLPVMLDVNLMDETERLGVKVDIAALERQLGISVVATALTTNRGVKQLRETIAHRLNRPTMANCPHTTHTVVQYPPAIETALTEIEAALSGSYQVTKRTIALLVLQNDAAVTALVGEQEGQKAADVLQIVERTCASFSQPLPYIIARQQQQAAQRVLQPVLTLPERRVSGFSERLSRAMMNPMTGLPLLILSLFLLYEFVGVFGAQTLVGFLENTVFGEHINPWVNQTLTELIPWVPIRNLFGGEYGIITLGVRYAVAIILPIVGTFFLAFAVIEDSGYLPRLAMLIDRVFKKIGLNGRAVIPMALGLGCDTMATIVTRTLETRRERILSTLLLALAVPCSAQLGVMFGLLGGRPDLLVLWGLIVVGVFLLVGLLAAKVMPGERPTFYMELPPLRRPTLGNVLVKTYTRMEWYFREVFPLFIIASIVIWVGQLTGLFDVAVSLLTPFVRGLGLPDQAAVAFLFGFFRRDYGAAGLYDLKSVMTGTQLLVATATMTLFVPCIAQFSVMFKERGWKTAMGIVLFIFPFAFFVGSLLNWLLTILRINL